MSDNKKYYYMRLKENFFDTDEMKILEGMKDGYIYSNILLKLYLMSLKHEGKLMLRDGIPYNPQMIATVTRHSVGDVEKALKTFQTLGLIEILETGEIYMLDIQSFIGKSSSEGERKRIYREKIKQKAIENCSKKEQVTQKWDIRPPEIELEKEIELNIINNTYVHNATQNAQVLSLQESWFNTFWNCYPNKKDKKRSKQKFLKACKTEDDFHNIMTGLNNTVVKQAKSEGKDFIPMASTWLNGERWNDPPYTPKQQKNNNTQESWSFMDEDI
jgi:predicted phage replisome organizer